MRTSRLNAFAVGAALAVLPSLAAAQTQPSFSKGTLQGASLSQPTSLQYGPDGRLYVSQQNGQIKAFTVVRNGEASYSVAATEVIELVRNIPNHNDDGTLETSQFNRMITGILVKGTPSNPVIYAASSDPRIAVGNDSGLDTNSGIISRLTWNGSSWQKLDIVRGLPRCEENHASNGMVIDEANGYMYLAQGGNTNMGAPSNNFGHTPEYALSAAILRIDLDAIGDTTYDIPTLDDPSRPNTGPGGADQFDPFGGNDGANQAIIVAGGPVQVWAPGYRNPFDVVLTSSGRLYATDNGPNIGWGGPPVNCSNQSNDSNSHTYGDQLHYLGETGDPNGAYGGHPTPFRAGATINGQSPIPPGSADPQECNFLIPGTQDGALHVWSSSTNGICEYTAGFFGGAMQGNLIAATWNSNSIERIILSPDGMSASVQTLFSNVGSKQLDVTTQAPGQVFAGTIWSCDHPGGKVYVFEPEDSGVCTGENDPGLDDDSDGYDNADEIVSGTDPCSAADIPPDNDGDLTGDLIDTDDDNDAIPDTIDRYAIDPANGLATDIPLAYGWAIGEPGFGLLGLGFTGLMSDGVDYLDHFDPDQLTPGGAAGKFTVDSVDAGDALGALNTQNNAFQFGVNVSQATGKFVVKTEVDAPFFDGRSPVGAESVGIYIGSGDQDNYVKIAVGTREGSAGVGVHLVKESGGSVSLDTLTPLDFLSANDVELSFLVDPVAGTAQPRVAIDGGAAQDIGGPIALSGATLDAVRSSGSAMAVGIIATSRGGAPFAGTWDYLSVAPLGAGAEAVLAVDPPGSGINGSTYGNGSFKIQNTSTAGQKITRVAYGVHLAAMPDLVFDPDATAGDTTGRPFTPDANAGTVGLTTHNFAFPQDGGYQTLAVNFDDFDPGESFAFAVDMDPTSINGVSAPGPNESGSVSGLELTGAYVRVEFDDGTMVISDLFRKPGSLDTSEAIMRPGTRAAPTVDVLGVSEPSIVTSPAQTVRVTGAIGSDVRLVVIEGGLFLAGVPGGGFDIDPFEANSAVSVQEYAATIGAGGFVDVPITLVKTNASSGISHIVATIVQPDGWTGLVSDASVVHLVDQDLAPTPTSLSFGSVVEGDSVTQGVTLNAAGSSVQVTGISVTGAGFTQVGGPALPTTVGAGGSLGLNVAFAPASGGAYSGALTVTHSGNNSPLVIPLSGQALTDSGAVLHRINVGGPATPAADATSPDWSMDTQGSPSPYLLTPTSFFAAGAAVTLDPSVPPQAPMVIFQTSRWDAAAAPEMHWALPVDPGTQVEVRLYLAELWSGASSANKRVFDVSMEGQTVFNDVDMSGSHGFRVGYVLAHQLTVQDGTLDIELLHEIENPSINAIEVVVVGGGGGNAPPVAVGDAASVAQGGQVVIPLLANDSDSDGTLVPSSVAVASGAAHGSVSINPATGAATYTHDGSSQLSDSFTYTVEDDDGDASNFATVSLTIIQDVEPGEILYRVNTGGPVVSATGGDWSIDTAAAPSAYVNVPASGNNTASTPNPVNTNNASVPAGTPASIFQSERWDPAAGAELAYAFPVASGEEVEVRLYFAETYNGINGAGQRVFDVSIDGAVVLDNYDPFVASGGKFIGRVERVVVTSDGSVDIAFGHVTENPSIRAIEIVSLGEAPEDTGVATLGVTPDGPIGAGTEDARAFRLTNDSAGGELIERVRVTLPGTVFPDMVFDPFGGAGDAAALALRVDTDPGVGVGAPQYVLPHNGIDGAEGYDALELTFTDFEPGETFEFAIDVDPLSIHAGSPGGPAAGVSGLELAGATVEVEYDSGLLRTAELAPIPGVAGGARVVVQGGRPAAPSITLDTIGFGPGLVLSAPQTVHVTGAPGANVRVYVVEGHMRPDGVPGGGYALDAYEANTAVVVSEQTITLNGSGLGDASVTLTRTDAPSGTIGLNHVFAVSEGAGGVSDLSNVVVAELRSIGTGEVSLYKVNAGGPEIPSPDGGITPGWTEDQAVAAGSAGGPANPGTPSPYVNAAQTDKTGGTTAAVSLGASVPAGTPMAVFQTERWDQPASPEMLWSFPVQPGTTLEVRLYMSEIYNGITAPGQRLFDVMIEGQLAMDNVDRFAESGGQKIGYVRSYTLTAGDDTLQVQLLHVQENPAICGIEVLQLAGAGGPPSVVGDSAQVARGGGVIIDVLANDSDSDGDIDPSSVQVVVAPSNGSVVINPANGAITYTHNNDGAKNDALMYTVRDLAGNVSDPADVVIQISDSPSNAAPTAAADSSPFNPGASVVIDVLANDSDPDGSLDPSTVYVTTQPAYGTTSVNVSTGAITYTNTDDSAALDSFAYTVGDNLGAVSAPATVSVATNPAPTAVNDSAVVIESDQVEIDVLANDTDDDELDPSSVTITTQPQFGSASVNPSTGAITYTHDGTPAASDTLAYTVRDNNGLESGAATVSISIHAAEDGVLIEAGLVLRLESDQGLASGGGGVTGWADLSPTGAQVLVIGNPTLAPGAVNGLDAVGLDGIDDSLETIDGHGALPTGNADRSVFLVARYHSDGVGFAHGQTPPSCPSGDAMGLSIGTDADGTLIAGGACPGAAFDSGVQGADGEWMSQALVLGSGAFTHYRDGAAIDNAPISLATGVGPAVLGRTLDGGTMTQMDVAAVLVYDRALTEPQRQSVERYLRVKYLNLAPTAGEDVAQADRGGQVEIDVLANDSDSDGTLVPASVQVAVPPASGTTSVNPGTGAITYTHDGSLTTTDELFYTVDDELGATSDMTMVVIDIVNPCPADVAAPLGILDVSDILLFLDLFGAGDPAADIADPPGVFDIEDVLLFLQVYATGCD